MMRRFNPSGKTSPVDFIVEYRTTPNETTFFSKYNLISNSDGSVYDRLNKECFTCIHTWAEAIIGND